MALLTVYTALETRLKTMGFSSVETALQDEVPKSNSARLWLAADNEVVDQKNSTVREWVWLVQITVAHSETLGASQTAAMAFIDQIRDGFAGWEPAEEAFTGIIGKSVAVPKIELIDFKTAGPIEYLAQISMRVHPEQVAAV